MRPGSSSSLIPDAITGYPPLDSAASSSTSTLTPDGFNWDATGVEGRIDYMIYDPRTRMHYNPAEQERGYRGLALEPMQDSPSMYAQAQANRNLFREDSRWLRGDTYQEESANAWTRRQALLRLARLDPQNNELGAIYSEIDRLVFYNPLKYEHRVEDDYNAKRLPTLQRDPIDGQLILRQPQRRS